MRNQDGSLDVQRDPTFLAESGVLPKVGLSCINNKGFYNNNPVYLTASHDRQPM